MIDVAELTEATPGASDEDREAWLAERRTGITATEIRDLYLGKTTIAKLVNLKLGRAVDDFAGNGYTRWGKEREPVIAAEVERRYTIAPESRVFHAKDEPRFLASPDGVGRDFDGRLILSEIKTAGKDIGTGTDLFAEKGYLAQMAWQCRVMGAQACVYAWEERLIGADGFEPGAQTFYWIERALMEQLLAKLEQLGHEFLAALDKAAAEPWEPSGVDDEIDTLAVNYLRFLGEEKEAADAKTRAFEQVKERLRGRERFTQASMLARVTWTGATSRDEVERVEVAQVDEKAAARAHPQIAKDRRLAAAALQRAQERVGAAEARLNAAEAVWAAALPEFTTTVVEEHVTVRTTRENLRITAPKLKGTGE